jgi:nucleotide-binding universal stress UspA family protein
VEPSQGCWYRLGTICSDAVGDRTHNDAMASTGRFSSEPLASADRPQQSGRIVVGVDASQGSLNALLWALGEARARKIPVHAVLAWQYRPSWVDPGLGSMFPLGYVPDDGGPPHEFADAVASVEKLLDAAVSKATESDPESATDPVRITQETVEGHAAQVLLESVTGCDTLVVGSHGHGGFVGAMLGSVSHHLVSHSRCPVVVVPAPQRAAKG